MPVETTRAIVSCSARELMNSGAGWVRYVNDVVLRDVQVAGISIDGTYRIDTGPYSTSRLLELFKNTGWSWPRGWLRRNRNRLHRGGIHLENQVENGRWVHLIIVPQTHLHPCDYRARRVGKAEWNLPPSRVDLHAENGWLRPSSVAHFCDFIGERYLLPIFRRFD